MSPSALSNAPKPKFAVGIPTDTIADQPMSAEDLYRYAERAEELELDGLWTFEHFFAAPPSYKYSRYDPLLALAGVAARTKKIDIGTCVLLLPLRNPIHVAKDVATLDNLSSGRLILGVGAGWSEKEFAISQVPLGERAPRMAESIRILKILLSEENVSYKGRFFEFNGITIEPRPVQTGGPPILYGGGTVDPNLYPPEYPVSTEGWRLDRVLKRIARISDGIVTSYRSFPVTSAAGAERDWDKIKRYASGYGRDASKFGRVHLSHFYISSPGDKEMAGARKAVSNFTQGNFDYLRQMYVLGDPEEAAAILSAWIRTSGIRYFVLNPIADYVRQIEILAKEVLPLVSVT